MEKQLTWTKGYFDSNYQLFDLGNISGSILFENWNNNAKGIALTKSCSFKTEGFTNPTTHILNENNEVIGVIKYESWQTKATITMTSGAIYGWSFTNSWLSNWMITDFKQQKITYKSNSGNGNIQASATDEIMLLTGIFIREFYARILIVCIMLFLIPTFTRIAF